MAAPSSPTTRYEDVLSRAVASLPHDVNERLATYDRARDALTTRLRSVTPPVPEAAIEAERAALETAIQRVEMRFTQFIAEASEPPPEPVPTTNPLLKTRRRGAVVAIVFGVGVVLALVAGMFAFMHRRDIQKAAHQGLRQTAVQPDKNAGTAPAAQSHAAAAVPYLFMRQLVYYRSTNPAGTVVIDKAQRYLYVILANVSAIRYGIALGGNCSETAGRYTVSRKLEPKSTPKALPVIDFGALYLDSDTHLIHGTDASSSIGQLIAQGCFLLVPTDLAELYGRVPVGTRVLVN